MRNGINKVTLMGHVGEMPKVTMSGDSVSSAQFSLATNESYNDKEGKAVQKTEWHRIVCFNKKAETVSKYVKKGDQLYVEGKIRANNWEDKEGVKHHNVDIMCDNFLFLSSRNSKNE